MHLYRIRPSNIFLVKCCCTRDEPLQSKFYPCSHFHGLKKFARMHYWQILTFFTKNLKINFRTIEEVKVSMYMWTMK